MQQQDAVADSAQEMAFRLRTKGQIEVTFRYLRYKPKDLYLRSKCDF